MPNHHSAGVAALPILKPWPLMTAIEQAEHLVHDHGLDAAYFLDGGAGQTMRAMLDDDAAVVTAFVTTLVGLQDAAGDASFPHPVDRNMWHVSEHEFNPYGEGWAHKHAPGSTVTRIPEADCVPRLDLAR